MLSTGQTITCYNLDMKWHGNKYIIMQAENWKI